MTKIIKEAMLETNEVIGKEVWTDITNDTEIFGAVESLDLVGLIYIIEGKLEKKVGRKVQIVTDKAYSVEHSPFKTVGSFAKFLKELI